MIDTDNLRTASVYINNQLLSRGLLRDGDSIDFASIRLSGDEEEATVPGRIISILNDLILRRDRDAEHRESLSTSMRALRAENIKLAADLTRVSEKHAEVQRKADLATSAESTLKTQLKSAEANTRALKEEVSRMKSLVSQTRSSCAMEIRRRDRQIDTLKRQLGEAGRSRGTRGNPAITTITVTGSVGSDRDSTTSMIHSSNYDPELRGESNTTLAHLAQHLTEENEAMLSLMQQTMAQLRDMSGWGTDDKQDQQVQKRPTCEDLTADLDSVMDHMRTILTNPSFVPIEEVVTREEEINRLKTGWIKMENRWREAVHLMDGWRKRMAVSGKPVCDEELRMGMRLSPVRESRLDETRAVATNGLSAVKEETEEEENACHFLRSPCPGNADRGVYTVGEDLNDEGDDSDGDVADHGEGVPHDHYDTQNDGSQDILDQPVQEVTEQQDDSLDSIPLPERPQLSPLRKSSSAGNRGFLRNTKPRLGPSDCAIDGAESTHASESKSMRSLPVRPRALASQSRLPSRSCRWTERPRSPSRTSLDDAMLPKRDADPPPLPQGSIESAQCQDESEGQAALSTAEKNHPSIHVDCVPKLPPQAMEPKPAQSPLTMSSIAAKLAASEKEADAARLRAKLKSARGSTWGVSRPVMMPASAIASEPKDETPVDKASERAVAGGPTKQGSTQPEGRTEKRKRDRKVSKAASRRRSTLSPLELQTLISADGR